jgi:ATP-dependent DNA helicase RecG
MTNYLTPTVTPTVTPEVETLLAVLTHPMSFKKLLAKLGLSDPKNLRERYQKLARIIGSILRTGHDKHYSRPQMYCKEQ